MGFLSKITPRGLLNKHPTEKNFSPPGGGAGEISAAEGGRKIFLRPPPGVDPPLVPKPVPTYEYSNLYTQCENLRNLWEIELFRETNLLLGNLLLFSKDELVSRKLVKLFLSKIS